MQRRSLPSHSCLLPTIMHCVRHESGEGSWPVMRSSDLMKSTEGSNKSRWCLKKKKQKLEPSNSSPMESMAGK